MTLDVKALTEDWHRIAKSGDPSGLDDLLDDDVVFYSPVVHTPQVGKAITKMYLAAAMMTLGNDTFRYTSHHYSDNGVVLQFETTIDGILINGIDMITFNETGKIAEFKVMVRPLKAVNMLHQQMKAMLEAMTP